MHHPTLSEYYKSDFKPKKVGRDQQKCFINRKKYIRSEQGMNIPFLEKICQGQKSTRRSKKKSKKCYRNKCFEITKVISDTAEVSAVGNVVTISTTSNPLETFILKWNRIGTLTYSEDLARELKIQKELYKLGVAPKVLDYYVQFDRTKMGNPRVYLYIFMENLMESGYSTIKDLYGIFSRKSKLKGFKKIPKKILINIAKVVDKMHKKGIAHLDLHAGNIFYNPKTNKVKLIDFGLSKKFKNRKEAFENEDEAFYLPDGKEIPEKWDSILYIIKSFYKKNKK